LLYFPDAGSVLAVPYNKSAILLNRPQGASHLRLGSGLHFPGGIRGTNAVTFRAFAINTQDKVSLLWSHHFDSAAISDDRSNQQAYVDLGDQEFTRIVLETVPDVAITNEAATPFWSEIHFE
jgi:hypothetical protein